MPPIRRPVGGIVACSIEQAPADTLRGWVQRAEVDGGLRPGTTTGDATRLTELERENLELRRANAILRSASAFFAAELDRPQSR